MRARLGIAGIATCALALWPGSAVAVLGGQPDSSHPYVALIAEGQTACSGTLLSPTVMLTAAHCFAADSGGAPLAVHVYFSAAPAPNVDYYTGTFYFDHAFATSNGLPGADTHDIAVVIFSAPIPTTVTSVYAALPQAGIVDTLPTNAPIDLVGYGVQDFARGGGQPQPVGGFTRLFGQTTLIASHDTISSEFAKLHRGACFGDSGGPDLEGGTNVVVAVNSFVNDSVCAGTTYSYRIDTQQARAFLGQYIALP